MKEHPNVDSRELQEVLRHIADTADARTVFGETVISGERAVIPVARVHHRGAGGVGGGGGSGIAHECTPECPPDCDATHAEEGYGSGMGVGYAITAEPVGVVEVTPDGVYWNPTVDYGRLAVIGAVAAGAIAVIAALGAIFGRD